MATWDFEDEAFDEISEDAKDFISMLLIKSMRCVTSGVHMTHVCCIKLCKTGCVLYTLVLYVTDMRTYSRVVRKRMTVKQCLQHKWMSQDVKYMRAKRLSTAKHKRFMARRKWQVRDLCFVAVRVVLLHRTKHTCSRSLQVYNIVKVYSCTYVC